MSTKQVELLLTESEVEVVVALDVAEAFVVDGNVPRVAGSIITSRAFISAGICPIKISHAYTSKRTKIITITSIISCTTVIWGWL